MSVGHYGPTYHESVCCFHRNRARFTKILDFVPLHIWLIPSKPFLEFFFEIFKKLNVQNFRGSSSMSWKIEKIEKNPFFFKKSYFFWLNLFCIHSQLSFEVYNSSVAQNLKFSLFFAWKFSFLTVVVPRPVAAKVCHLGGYFWCLWKAKDHNIYLRSSFGALEGILANFWCLLKVRAIMAPPRLTT